MEFVDHVRRNERGHAGGWLKQHGYCFDVPASARTASVPAVALPDMGRFSHEAIAVDPNTWIVYETEDNGGKAEAAASTASSRTRRAC